MQDGLDMEEMIVLLAFIYVFGFWFTALQGCPFYMGFSR
jgi:hypothetical protein